MTVTVDKVPFKITGFGEKSNAKDLVNERFEDAKVYAADQITATKTYLAALSTLFATAVMPGEGEEDTPFEFHKITLDSALDRPNAPTTNDLTPGPIDFPICDPLTIITVPTITIPSYDIVAPTDETAGLDYAEDPYQSDLQDALKEVLKTFVETGGTGLGEDIEDALWARARARQEILNEKVYNEAEEYFATRNYSLPAGALGGRLTEALNEIGRADAQLNYEITIEQARLARAQSEYSLTAALTLEGQDKEKFTALANRTLEAAKATSQVIIDLFGVKVQSFIAQYEAEKLKVEAERLKVDIAIAANSDVKDTYKVDLEKYKVQMQAEISIVESIAKVYGYEIAGYEADVKVATADLEAQIKQYQGEIDQTNNKAILTLKEAEMTIQSYLGALQLTADSIKTSGTISAQIAASALSAVNASASLGDSYAANRSVSDSYSASLGNSASVSEVHRYDETAT